MAINREPKIRTLGGKSITVSKWITCNLESEFASTVFEVDEESEFDDLIESNELILSSDDKEYLVKLNRLHQGKNVRVNGRIQEHNFSSSTLTK